MSTNTTNYNLVKPGLNETADIEVINQNMDVIDTGLKNVSDKADGKISKSLATAANQFLLSSAVGQFVVKTVDEIKSLLGLKGAAEKEFNTAGGVASYDTVQSHLSDYVRQPGYAITTGAANTYLATLNPAPTAYVDGMGIVVKINVANTGAATVNVNGLGAKPMVDGKGNTLTSGKLRLNSTYSLKYNSTSGNFILQGSDSSGNATPADLLAGKTASTDAGDIVGAMPNYSGTMQPAQLVEVKPDTTPGVLMLHPKPGYYDAVGNVAAYDPNFVAANIVSGKSIFGLAGSYAVIGKKWASGTIFVGAVPAVIFKTISNEDYWMYPLTVSGLTFKPSKIIIRSKSGSVIRESIYQESSQEIDYPRVVRICRYDGGRTTQEAMSLKADVAPAYVTSAGFTLPVDLQMLGWVWEAYE